jgi:hypothetical protein
VDEYPDVSFYVLSEPALTAPAPDDIGVWQDLAHLRTENLQWRECVQGILRDLDQHRSSVQALKGAIETRVQNLAHKLAQRDQR